MQQKGSSKERLNYYLPAEERKTVRAPFTDQSCLSNHETMFCSINTMSRRLLLPASTCKKFQCTPTVLKGGNCLWALEIMSEAGRHPSNISIEWVVIFWREFRKKQRRCSQCPHEGPTYWRLASQPMVLLLNSTRTFKRWWGELGWDSQLKS